MPYIGNMKQIAALTLAACLAMSPATAQTSDGEDGLNLMEEGAKMLLRGLMSEMEPGMNEFRELMEDFGPQISAMMTELGPRMKVMLDIVDDFGNYGDPELLPNGDIIIRRNPDAPAIETPSPDGEIEL